MAKLNNNSKLKMKDSKKVRSKLKEQSYKIK